MSGIKLPLAIVVASLATNAGALPLFARREGVSCSGCHVNIPRLNRIGFEYRDAGYRLPGSLGQVSSPSEFGSFNSVAVKNEESLVRQSGTTEAGEAAPSRAQTTFQFAEASLYLATGAFGRFFSSSAEVALAPGETEIEKAYLRFTYGSDEMHLNLRAGIIHPFDGYGASDESLGLSDPLFREAAPFDRATGSQAFFAPMNFNQAAVEVGYTHRGFNATAALLNGIFVTPDGDAGAFIGGDLSRPQGDPNYSKKDIRLFANQFFGEAALSAYWYRGTATTPYVPADTAFANKFDRLALYGTLPVASRVWLLGGVQGGWDRRTDAAGTVLPDRYRSVGWFGEVYVPWNDYIGAALRYDRFDPSRGSKADLSQAVTVTCSTADLEGGQAILEYRYRDDQTGANASLKTNELRLRLQYVF